MALAHEIYMDYNATTAIADPVKAVMIDAMAHSGNPSSVHSAGRAAKKTIEDARTKVAALAGCRARDVVFTSGGSEANNLALFGAPANSWLISPLEHDAVLSCAHELQARGKTVDWLQLDDQGAIDLQYLEERLQKLPAPTLVSVMMVNNEIGLIQDLKPLIDLVHQYKGFVHSDCVQAAGKVMLAATDLDVDYLSLSAHKIYGPKGVGALVLKPTAPLKAQIQGGGQELGRRSGTENLPGIAGFGAAALLAMEQVADQDRLKGLRDMLEQAITAHASDAVIVGRSFNRASNVSCIAMPNVSGETQVMHFDLNGICLSSGSACSSGKVKPSHVLTALGYPESLAGCSIRVSLGIDSTQQHVDAFIKAWCTLYDRKKAG